MKILLVTQYFYPENFKSNDIAFELAKRGYDVTVLTGLPNYPKEERNRQWGKDNQDTCDSKRKRRRNDACSKLHKLGCHCIIPGFFPGFE